MKAIVIGFGKMGMLHAATMRMLGVDDVVICESSPLLRSGVAAVAPRQPIVESYQEVLAGGGVDLAVIATPTSSHATIFRTLAPQVRGIFVEKPFSVGVEAARGAIDTLPFDRRGGVTIGHCLRFAIPFVEAKRMLDDGAIGSIEHVRATMFSSDVLRAAGGWRSRSAPAGGGVLLDLGSHLIDMTRALFGMPREVSGSLSSVVSKGTEDAFSSEWWWGGFSGDLECSWSEPSVRKATLEVRVTGSRGDLFISDDLIELTLRKPSAAFDVGAHRFPITTLEQPVPFDLGGAMYTRQMQAWLAAVSGGGAPANGIDENLDNLRLIDLIRESHGQRLAVTR